MDAIMLLRATYHRKGHLLRSVLSCRLWRPLRRRASRRTPSTAWSCCRRPASSPCQVLFANLSLPSACILLSVHTFDLRLQRICMRVPCGQGLSASAKDLCFAQLPWPVLHSVHLRYCREVCCCTPIQDASA